MILSGPEIRKQIAEGCISIDPFDHAQINPASYDLRLGRYVAMYEIDGPPWLDCARAHDTTQFEIDDHGLVLFPRRLYLMHTVERIRTDHFVPIVDGRSSIGRLGRGRALRGQLHRCVLAGAAAVTCLETVREVRGMECRRN
jgi:dCTP deaminase